jgi:hypothetical protein
MRRKKGFWNAIKIFEPQRHGILTGDVKTFKDLAEKIIDEREKNRA